jgi:hypothetical protein
MTMCSAGSLHSVGWVPATVLAVPYCHMVVGALSLPACAVPLDRVIVVNNTAWSSLACATRTEKRLFILSPAGGP